MEYELKEHLIPVTEVPEIVEFANKQLKIFWLPDEPKVEKDIQDVLVNFTESERHAVITTLKLFSLYETHAGDEYWGSRFKQIFNGAEFHRLASVFSMFELAVHSPFYNKINQLLNLDDKEFYLSYKDVPAMQARLQHVDSIINDSDDFVSLAGFSLVEGVILYSAFGFLKHYQSNGKNKLMNVVRGINFSLADENLHAEAGAWCFRYKLAKDKVSIEKQKEIEAKILELARTIYEHEKELIKITFAKGAIEGVTPKQVEHFVESRINLCLKNLGYKPMFEVKYNPIADWFYDGIQNYKFGDFFTAINSEYHRQWDEKAFVW